MRAATTLQVRRATATKNAHGQTTYTFADPHDWAVYGLAPGARAEAVQPNRDVSEVAWTIFAPVSDDAPTAKDLVVLDGTEYPVEGEPQDWSRGPFGSPGGLVVELKRGEG